LWNKRADMTSKIIMLTTYGGLESSLSYHRAEMARGFASNVWRSAARGVTLLLTFALPFTCEYTERCSLRDDRTPGIYVRIWVLCRRVCKL